MDVTASVDSADSVNSLDSTDSADSGFNPYIDNLGEILRRPILKKTCKRLLLNFKQSLA